MTLKGTLKGHNGWVTQIATNLSFPDMIISSSRDKTVLIWKLKQDDKDDVGSSYVVTGRPERSLHGHGHFVSDVVMSSDGQWALSGSWDRTLRLWDLNTGQSTKQFTSHTKDVLSVALSADNRQIVSGSRDKTIKLWNTLASCKYTITDDCHQDWVSAVRFSPSSVNPAIVSAGWDKLVKVWSMANCRLKINNIGHSGYINTVAVSPDGLRCASGGKDGNAMLWDLEQGKHLRNFEGNGIINALAFSPNIYWLCAAVGPVIKIWDLDMDLDQDQNQNIVLYQLKPDIISTSSSTNTVPPQCISLSWSFDGQTLYAGYTDKLIRVWQISVTEVKKSK